ncbi:MAG: very short patch repair endonuclease, partial [Candidatus Contendobacter sp.]|nr:very short patch repair endonuclease [Candidatus Contendobacter sp.]
MAQTPSEVRSRTMRAVKSRDTQPEMIVRRMVHAMG